jgi:hypothetical protein
MTPESDGATAYRVWRVDCPCGTVIDYGEDDHPDICEECGALVTESDI